LQKSRNKVRAKSAAHAQPLDTDDRAIPGALRQFVRHRLLEFAGFLLLAGTIFVGFSLATWSVDDPSLNNAVDAIPQNWFGLPGAIVADELMQLLGLGSVVLVVVPVAWTVRLFAHRTPDKLVRRLAAWCGAVVLGCGLVSLFPLPSSWILGSSLGGIVGDAMATGVLAMLSVALKGGFASAAAGLILGTGTAMLLLTACGVDGDDVVSFARIFGERVQDVVARTFGRIAHGALYLQAAFLRLRAFLNRNRAEPEEQPEHRRPVIGSSMRGVLDWIADWGGSQPRVEPLLVPGDGPSLDWSAHADADDDELESDEPQTAKAPIRVTAGKPVKPGKRLGKDRQQTFAFDGDTPFALPPLTLLSEPKTLGRPAELSADALEQNARMLEGVLKDFGVRGEIVNVRPGPGRDAVRTRARSRHQIVARDRACRRHRPFDERGVRARRRRAGPQRHRHRIAQFPARDGFSARNAVAPTRSRSSGEAHLPICARQDHWRRAGNRRSRAHAALADRGHDRFRQIGRHQYDDPLAPLSHHRPRNAGSS
jgi:DNA segregation ATPase FtsK/SpoIIIE, S-DNA-T family